MDLKGVFYLRSLSGQELHLNHPFVLLWVIFDYPLLNIFYLLIERLLLHLQKSLNFILRIQFIFNFIIFILQGFLSPTFPAFIWSRIFEFIVVWRRIIAWTVRILPKAIFSVKLHWVVAKLIIFWTWWENGGTNL